MVDEVYLGATHYVRLATNRRGAIYARSLTSELVDSASPRLCSLRLKPVRTKLKFKTIHKQKRDNREGVLTI